MQLVVPNVVTIAVRIVITTLMTVFQTSLFFIFSSFNFKTINLKFRL